MSYGVKHRPTLYWAGRHGSWATCCCGWQSRAYTTVVGAHIAFGHHLLDGRRASRD